jgi:hypothetical protein
MHQPELDSATNIFLYNSAENTAKPLLIQLLESGASPLLIPFWNQEHSPAILQNFIYRICLHAAEG